LIDGLKSENRDLGVENSDGWGETVGREEEEGFARLRNATFRECNF